MSTAVPVGLLLFIVPFSVIVFVYQKDIIGIGQYYLLLSSSRSNSSGSTLVGKYTHWVASAPFWASGNGTEVTEVATETETEEIEIKVKEAKIETVVKVETDIILGGESCRRRGSPIQTATVETAIEAVHTAELNTNDGDNDDDNNDDDNDNIGHYHHHRHHHHHHHLDQQQKQQQKQQQQQQKQRRQEVRVQQYEQEQIFVGVTPFDLPYGSWEDELIRYNSEII